VEFNSSYLRILLGIDQDAHGKQQVKVSNEVKVTEFVAKQTWERKPLAGEAKGELADYLQQLESGEAELVISDVTLGNLLTGGEDHMDSYTYDKVNIMVNGLMPKGLPVDLPYLNNQWGVISFGLAYDPRKPGELVFIMNIKESYYNDENIERKVMLFLAEALRIPDDDWPRVSAIDKDSGKPYMGGETGGEGERIVHSIWEDLDTYIDGSFDIR